MNNTSSSNLSPTEGNPNSRIPASRQQQQIWMLQQLYPDNPAYNLSVAFRIKGELNIESFNRSFIETVNLYEILHTCFQMDQGELKQVIKPIKNISIINEELGVEHRSGQSESIDRYIKERASAPFDLEKAPLIRAFLLQIASDDHLLLLVSHQTVLDHASMDYLLHYISEQYSFFTKELLAKDQQKPIQYSNYIEHQQQQQQNDEAPYDESLDYWKNAVLKPDGFLDIPVGNTRPSAQNFEGEKIDCDLTDHLSAQINKLAQEMDIPVPVVFLGIFRILLFRYTGNGGFSIGFPFVNRKNEQFKDLIGPLENFLPLTSDISDSPALGDALLRTHTSLQNASSHQDVTFNSIVEIIKPSHDPSYNPIFQVGFRFMKTPGLMLDNLETTHYDCFNKTSILDLFLNIIDDEGRFKLQMVYNPGLFDSSAITAFAEHYETLLDRALESQEVPISLLDILPETAKQKQLIGWNTTKKPPPKYRKIHEFFEYQASLSPDSIAVEFEKITLTYKELNQRANQLAHFLQKYKVAPDVLVGVCLERSCEMMIALLGVLKAGGGYIPMDPDYPKDRIAYIAENSNAPVLITQQSLLSFLPETEASIVCIDRDWQEIETYSVDKFPDKAEPGNIAYVIYTSGSTGRPKGVQIPHGAVANLMDSMAREPGMNKNDVLLCVTTYSFDLSVPDLYLPLYTGARTVYVKREIAADGALLAKILNETGATFMQATPSTWTLLLDSGWEGSKVLTALCGGEAWPRKLARRLVPRVKALWNMYGPTETTVWSTCYHVSTPDSEVLIGKPMDNTSVYILDDNLQLVPVGVPGELYIGGHGVSRGYLRRPELNKNSFIANPFEIQGHPEIYKTGDSVRYRQDGNLEYLNRLDNQVKIRGLRIELGEIESILLKFPNIKQGVVVVREDNPDDKRLVGYFDTDDGNKIGEKELREFLKTTLPSYMVPQHLIQLDEFPRTLNGKIDRKALPVPQQVIGNEKPAYQDPTHLEKLPMDDWFYKPVWKPVQLESNAELPQAAICLIFLDEDGIGEELVGRLREKEYIVITVRSSDSYYKFNENDYCINPEQGLPGYLSLAADLAASGRHPNRIAHLWMLTGKETFRPGSSFFHRNLEHGFYSILHLIQAFNKQGLTGRTQLLVALNGSQKVYSEYLPYPEKACVLGPCMVMTREFPQMKTTVVDFDFFTKKQQFFLNPGILFKKRTRKRFVKILEKELLLPSENEVIAYRKRRRFVKQYVQVTLPSSSAELLRRSGVYLIAGGLGKKGKLIAHYLAKNVQARLIIVDKKQLPDKKNWDDFLSETEKENSIANGVETIRELESYGQDVIYYSADIADAEKMRILMDDAGKRFCTVDGIIHAASMDTSGPISMQDDNKVEQCFAAKVKGTLVFDQLVRELGIDLFVLFSSSDLITAGPGSVQTTAAGAFMDAYAENCAANNKNKTICLDWGNWRHLEDQKRTGLDYTADPSANLLTDNERFLKYIYTHGINSDESLQVFKKSLAGQSGVLVVSPISLSVYSSEIELRCSGFYGDEIVEPRNDIEGTLVEFWKEIIGIRNLGVRQNFFDVGGHSLTAVRLFAKIKQQYDVQWPLSVLFEAPTIEECARLIQEEVQDNKQNKEEAGSHTFRFLVKMHGGAGNDAAPIYIAAGGFGNILNLRHLAQLLGNDRPVFGIQAKGLLGDELPHETFESAAIDYLKEVRKVQPEGPYILAGFCSGGTIAYEMAQQLIDDDERVSHVIMLDTIATDWREELTKKDKIAFHKMSFKRTGIKYPFIWIINRFKWEWKKVKEMAGLNKEETGPAVFRGRAIFDATLRAENRYKPKAYAGKVTLFRPKLDQFVHLDGGRAINKYRDFVRSDNGWSPHIKHFDIQEIAAEPGDHDGFVLEPAVRDLYSKFKNILKDK